MPAKIISIAQRAQLALGLASFILLLVLVSIMLFRTEPTSEGRHEVQHSITVNGEPIVVLTRSLHGESVDAMMLRHKDLLDCTRKGTK